MTNIFKPAFKSSSSLPAPRHNQTCAVISFMFCIVLDESLIKLKNSEVSDYDTISSEVSEHQE